MFMPSPAVAARVVPGDHLEQLVAVADDVDAVPAVAGRPRALDGVPASRRRDSHAVVAGVGAQLDGVAVARHLDADRVARGLRPGDTASIACDPESSRRAAVHVEPRHEKSRRRRRGQHVDDRQALLWRGVAQPHAASDEPERRGVGAADHHALRAKAAGRGARLALHTDQ
jgi:hypothetical protein